MTTTEETAAQYRGAIIIEWPQPVGKGPHGCIAGYSLSITDATTGKQITTCSHADITVHADAAELVTADLTLFVGEDGEPLLNGPPVPDYDAGEIRTGVFPFLVAEMRVR